MRLAFLLIVSSLGSASLALAQATAAPAHPKKLSWILSLRSRYEGWSWFDPGDIPATANDNASYGFLAEQAHVGLRYDATGWLDLLADAQVTALAGLPDDANAPPPFGTSASGPATMPRTRSEPMPGSF